MPLLIPYEKALKITQDIQERMKGKTFDLDVDLGDLDILSEFSMSKIYLVIKKTWGDFDIAQNEVVAASLSKEKCQAFIDGKPSDSGLEPDWKYSIKSIELLD